MSWGEISDRIDVIASAKSRPGSITLGERYNIFRKILRFNSDSAKAQECSRFRDREPVTTTYSQFVTSIQGSKILNIGMVICDMEQVNVQKIKPLEDQCEHSWVIVVKKTGTRRETFVYDPNLFGKLISAGLQLTNSKTMPKSMTSRAEILSRSQKRVLIKLGGGRISPDSVIWTMGQGNESIRTKGICLRLCLDFLKSVVEEMDEKGDWSPPASEFPLRLKLKRPIYKA